MNNIYLDQAKQCAGNGDIIGMLKALNESQLLEKYNNYFRKKYNPISNETLSDIIGSAIDELYVRIQKQEKIRAIDSYLFKVIDTQAKVHYNREKRIDRSINIENVGELFDPLSQENEIDLRGEAIKITKSLIPRLGLENVQNVMNNILGCIENGAQDINSNDIGEALGLNPATVRKCMERGFQRLARIVKEEGLIDYEEIFDINQIRHFIIEENKSDNFIDY